MQMLSSVTAASSCPSVSLGAGGSEAGLRLRLQLILPHARLHGGAAAAASQPASASAAARRQRL